MTMSRIVLKRGSKDEAEKPFWISFADLMTALMVLFMLVMSVALLAVVTKPPPGDDPEARRRDEISALLTKLENVAKNYPGVTVDRKRNVIDFGDRARFDIGSHQLSQKQSDLLRKFVPEVLSIAREPEGERWLKRIVVEGFTDKTGDYLYNLNLSLQRSQRVLCVLLAETKDGESGLDLRQKGQVRDLFLVGGYSFNSSKDSNEESRRIELRLEFLGLGESRPGKAGPAPSGFGQCAVGA
jgi:outer membrane protein OmpA-like peptidoglycan-associated protein